mmetsp:Transcript_102194/g.286473  ORF Transcript_102194/g.286473 Transcript_102194/m.286473 type:complete len:232 (-) Transcript_102194:238-933(-)
MNNLRIFSRDGGKIGFGGRNAAGQISSSERKTAACATPFAAGFCAAGCSAVSVAPDLMITTLPSSVFNRFAPSSATARLASTGSTANRCKLAFDLSQIQPRPSRNRKYALFSAGLKCTASASNLSWQLTNTVEFAATAIEGELNTGCRESVARNDTGIRWAGVVELALAPSGSMSFPSESTACKMSNAHDCPGSEYSGGSNGSPLAGATTVLPKHFRERVETQPLGPLIRK